jgi:hypothetical protein
MNAAAYLLLFQLIFSSLEAQALAVTRQPSATTAQATLTLQFVVQPVCQIKSVKQLPLQQIQITAADVAQGFVQVSGAPSFEIESNANAHYYVQYNKPTGVFVGVSLAVSSPQKNAEVSAPDCNLDNEGAECQGDVIGSVNLETQLLLAENTLPGTYAWPLDSVVASCQID